MSSYLIVSYTPKNEEKLKLYNIHFNETLIKYSGQYLVKGPVEILNGNGKFEMQIIVLFPGRDIILDWYHSQEYQHLNEIRDESMDCQFQIVGLSAG